MNGTEMIVGIHPVREAVLSGRSIEKVLLERDSQNQRLFEILKFCRQKKIPVTLLPPVKLKYIAGEHCQGVAAKLPVREYVSVEKILEQAKTAGEAPFVLIPEGVEDPQNLGALIRTALCAGVHGVVIPDNGAAGLSFGTSKASAGAVEHMNVCRTSNMTGTLTLLKENKIRLLGFEAGQGKSVWDADLAGPVAVVLGGEHKGIRPHVKRHLDAVFHVPMKGVVGSLNVSATGAVVLYEIARRRIKCPV
jgi:23S rRNA (guanosine2251-2'-O)-methyltransferase